MASKNLIVLALLGYAVSVSAVTEVMLDDVEFTVYAQGLLGKSHAIPKGIFDTLLECSVVFPNGIIYQAFPENNLPSGNVKFLEAVEPFRACGVGVLPITQEDGGTYELYSYTKSALDDSLWFTRQKFTFHVREVDWRSEKSEE